MQTRPFETFLDRCNFPPSGTPVVCAVSGGADSSALLVLALAAGCLPSVVHVDHGLRTDSGDDAAAVVELCERLGVGCKVETVDVEPGANVEERARIARLGVVPDRALLGHTADDQAETLLLNLLRGAGPVGLAGMPADDRRPLLALRRSDTLAICELADIVPRHDPMNDDLSLRRVRVRDELLPLLDDIAERDVAPILARSAGLFAELADLVEALAADVDATDVRELNALSPVVARAALRKWIRDESGDLHPVDAAALERVMSVVRGEIVATEVPGGQRVSRSGGTLALHRVGPSEGRAQE